MPARAAVGRSKSPSPRHVIVALQLAGSIDREKYFAERTIGSVAAEPSLDEGAPPMARHVARVSISQAKKIAMNNCRDGSDRFFFLLTLAFAEYAYSESAH